MLVKEMIELLQHAPPDAVVRLTISNPKDSAWTTDVAVSDHGKILGWVASDDQEAFFPGERYDDESW